jgi:F-type H+-transporting ATPase subunit delta
MTVRIQSAVALTNAQMDEIKQKLHKTFNESIEIDNQVDPELLGGLRLVLPDKVVDLTLAAKLSQLAETLIS